MKRIVSILLSLLMIVTAIPVQPVAASDTSQTAESITYDLGRPTTGVMLVDGDGSLVGIDDTNMTASRTWLVSTSYAGGGWKLNEEETTIAKQADDGSMYTRYVATGTDETAGIQIFRWGNNQRTGIFFNRSQRLAINFTVPESGAYSVEAIYLDNNRNTGGYVEVNGQKSKTQIPATVYEDATNNDIAISVGTYELEVGEYANTIVFENIPSNYYGTSIRGFKVIKVANEEPKATSAPTPTVEPTATPEATITPTVEPTSAPTESPYIAEGRCGENLAWTLDKNGVLMISGRGQMSDYSSLAEIPWYSYVQDIYAVEIREGVTSIGNEGFTNCSNLESITLPSGLKSIGDGAFQRCSSLESITLPEGVLRIELLTFSGCSSLKSISLPKSLTSVGQGAFSGCEALTNIKLPKGITKIDFDTFLGCSSLTSIELPEGITFIDSGAFGGCVSLAEINLPKSLKIINAAFRYCSALTSIEFPENLTHIGNEVFSYSGVTEITFKGTSVPMTLNTEVGPFDDMSLETIYVPAEAYDDYVTAFANYLPDTAEIVPVGGVEEKTYTVTWLNANGEVLELDENVVEGEMPNYDGTTPTKDADAQYTYTFTGWTPEVVATTENATYTAVFDKTVNSYTVTWVNPYGEVIDTDYVEYGTVPTAPTATYKEYTFSNWDAEVVAVTGDVTYTAIYSDMDNIVDWTTEDGKEVGYYYVDGKVKKNAGLIKLDDYYYYVMYSGRIASGRNQTVFAEKTNGYDVEADTYYFFKNGIMETKDVRLEGEIVEVEGELWYYVQDEVCGNVGLVKVGDYYYYVMYSGRVASGRNQTIVSGKSNGFASEAGIEEGNYYYFFKTGVMKTEAVKMSGEIVEDENGVLWYYVQEEVCGDVGLVKIGEDFYYVRYSGKIVVAAEGKTKNQTIVAGRSNISVLEEAGVVEGKYYRFDDTGKLVR